MTTGSAYTMSYKKPSQWWLGPFAGQFRHQKQHIFWQYTDGCRVFDIHVVFKKGIPRFATSRVIHDGDVWSILEWLNLRSKGRKEGEDRIIVRIILERGAGEDLVLFEDFCKAIDRTFTELQFCGFRALDWSQYHWWTFRDTGSLGLGDHGSIHLQTDSGFSHFSSKHPELEYVLTENV